jgi:acyl-homoserine-lactone acylase
MSSSTASSRCATERSRLPFTAAYFGALSAATVFALALPGGSASAQSIGPADPGGQVEIIRTAYGVPHIRAENLRAAAYALAYVQLEDHGPRVALGLLRARGEYWKWFGRDSMDGDFTAQRVYRIAVEKYPLLDDDTRAVYEGFAAGVNRYIARHTAEFPPGFSPRFTGYDVAARDVNIASLAPARRFLARLTGQRGRTSGDDDSAEGAVDPDEGSNAWAFAPSRTKSGRAVLVRNPHLAWTAGYYEAHVTVPGVLDFYGDFRIGGPFGVVGGFNRHLGWATTNNAPDLDEIYSLDVDTTRADHYLLDGASLPLKRELVTVAFRNGAGLSTETREYWGTPLGPVIYRGNGKIYLLRAAAEGDYRGGQQFLKMMRAKSLAEWQDAMRMRARVNSSFTYADRAGNILYVWNAAIPSLPHANGRDTTAVHATRLADVWTRYVPYDSLPMVLNPRGGYVRNENDAPYHTNLRQVLDRSKFPANFPEPSLRLRSQLSLALIDNDRKMTLEEIMRLKHSYRMLLADRVKADLVRAVRAGASDSSVAGAIALIERWDNTAAHDSRGGVLFETWWRRYTAETSADTMFAHTWSASEANTTPRGLKNLPRAAEAFAWAVGEVTRRYGRYDVSWGEVHRVRIAGVDEPVGGCGGALGCFRVLNFREDKDGKRAVTGGDGWVLAVEFADTPRAYSILAYGQSPRPDSPYHSDQAAMFARGEMKRVLFTVPDVDAGAVRRYRPGSEK